MFSSRRLASASGCSRIVAAGASNERDGCCTTIVAWVDRFPPPPALPPFGYEKFTVGYAVPQAHRRCGVTSRRRRGESLCPPLSLSLSLSRSLFLSFSIFRPRHRSPATPLVCALARSRCESRPPRGPRTTLFLMIRPPSRRDRRDRPCPRAGRHARKSCRRVSGGIAMTLT
jgi:hypothetical protein